MSKSKQNQEIFNKEPQIYAKPHPGEPSYDPAVDTNKFKHPAITLRLKNTHSSQMSAQNSTHELGRTVSGQQTISINEDLDLEQNPKTGEQSSPEAPQTDQVQESRTTGFAKGNDQFSPSGVTSGLSDRDVNQTEGD